jgi:hypothetical protein
MLQAEIKPSSVHHAAAENKKVMLRRLILDFSYLHGLSLFSCCLAIIKLTLSRTPHGVPLATENDAEDREFHLSFSLTSFWR